MIIIIIYFLNLAIYKYIYTVMAKNIGKYY